MSASYRCVYQMAAGITLTCSLDNPKSVEAKVSERPRYYYTIGKVKIHPV